MVPFIADAGRREILRPAAVVVRFIKGGPLRGNEPPFSFRLRRKENGRSRSKEKALGRKTARCALFAYDTGVPARDCGGNFRSKRWARTLVLVISISLASGLRRKLAHSDARPLPTKTASLGFRGGPGFAETFRPSARDGLPSCGVGCKTDLTCVFPPLPLCRPRIGLPLPPRQR